MQSVPIAHHSCCEFESRSGEVYSIQHYVIKFDSDLRQAGGFLLVSRIPPPIKLRHDITEILLKVVLNTIIPPSTTLQKISTPYFEGLGSLCLFYCYLSYTFCIQCGCLSLTHDDILILSSKL